MHPPGQRKWHLQRRPGKTLALLSLLSAAIALIVWVVAPTQFRHKMEELPEQIVATLSSAQAYDEETGSPTASEVIQAHFPSWQPLPDSQTISSGTIQIGERQFDSLKIAAKALRKGDTLIIGEGIYRESFRITADHVTIRGEGHAILEQSAHKGKAAIVVRGNHTAIINIECRGIAVSDSNGACVRLSGNHLNINHVYFHDAQQGILTGKNPGKVSIEDSRFEDLGAGGRAHGIYVGPGGELLILNSLFIASKDEGHEVKSRAKRTIIKGSTIASLTSRDSRLVDVSNGGVLSITHSILQQGAGSSNADAIGFALEKRSYERNHITLRNNIILLERPGANRLIHALGNPELNIENNTIVSRSRIRVGESNHVFPSREAAGIPVAPELPLLP